MSTTQRIQAIVFDLDDTLYAERDYVRSGYHAVACHLRERLGRSDAFEDWLWARFLAGRSAGALDALNAEFALALTAARIADLVTVYRNHRPDIQPRGGAAELLERLRRRYPLGLLSDGFLPAQQLKLDALGLEGAFDAVVFTEAMGRDCWKPSPAGYLAVAERLGVRRDRCAYVADNPAKDFLAANELGWRTVRLLCEGQVHADKLPPPGGGAQVTVGDLAEIETALGSRAGQ